MEQINRCPIDLFHPLAILHDTTQRIQDQQVPFTSARLQEYFSHFRGAFADTLEAVRQHCQQVLQQARAGLDQESMLASIEQAEADLNAALDQVGATFFSAQTFQECEALMPRVELFESQAQTALLELEQTLSQVAEAIPFVPPPAVPEAMQRVSEGMSQVESYLADGDPVKLTEAIRCMEESILMLRSALPQA